MKNVCSAGERRLQCAVQLPEARPLLRPPTEAGGDERSRLGRKLGRNQAGGRRGGRRGTHVVRRGRRVVLQVDLDVVVAEVRVRLARAEREDFPDGDAERPDVALGRPITLKAYNQDVQYGAWKMCVFKK